MPNSKFWGRNTSTKAQKEIHTIAASAGLDAKAVNILFNAHYDADDEMLGWVQRKNTPAEDLQYAIEQGVMVAPPTLSHDDLVRQLVAVRERLDRQKVADAFVVSLRAGRQDLRSALGSYAVFLHLAAHPYESKRKRSPYCFVCGEEKNEATPRDTNSSLFVRLKWGGSIHHTMVDYACDDLSAFATAPQPALEKDDVQVLTEVLRAIAALPAKAQLGDLRKSFAGLFKSNQGDRQRIAETLGYCGILQSSARPSFRERFVTHEEREEDEASGAKQEWQWPAQHWTGTIGVNWDAVKFWFPYVKRPK